MTENYREQVYRLMLATNRCVSVYAKIAKEHGIKENTLLLMDILSDGKQHSQKQICKDWAIPKTTLNTIVGECTKSGYLTLSVQDQSREKLIILTDEGKIFAERITKKMNQAVEAAMTKTCKEFSSDFITVFEAYVDYLQKEI